jgi:hypothetical protein
MKSLNDSLREEFALILSEKEIQDLIISKRLDASIINMAFQKLLDNKYGSDDISFIEKGRAEFETLIINTLKTKKHEL